MREPGAMSESKRKLAAIMFTDIVGYTSLMEENEHRALKLLQKNREVQKPLIEKHGGTWLKEIGDGTLSSFPSAINAVQCAIEMQRVLKRDPKHNLRIGIHVGDMVFEEGDVFGAGVNVASRLEPLAEPGGICVSGRVYDDIHNKPDIEAVFLGEKKLKNVERPVRAYALQDEGLPKIKLAHVPREKERASPLQGQISPKSVAVLPFSNMSADKEQAYFCDGMAEEIINALAKIEGLRVAARTSSFAFKGKHEDIREIGKKLNVDKILEGSVRKSGKRLRITAQLINIEDGYHLWSERYDRELEDVFEIQDEISRAIVAALKVKLVDRKDKPLIKRPTDNLEAYDAYLRGVYCFNQRKKTENDKAIALFEQATNIDPKFALAFAGLAYAYIEKLFTYQPQKKWEEKAFVALKKALALDPELAEAYVAKGNLLWTKSNHFPHAEAIAEYERAIELKPTLVEAHNELARALWHVGALNRAYNELETALEIDPTYVDVKFRMGVIELQRCHFERALSLFRKIPQEAIIEWVDAFIALCLFYLDRKDEAFAHLEDLDEALSASPEVVSTEAIFLAMEGKGKEVIKKIDLATKKGKHFGHFHHITNNFAAA